MTRTVYTVDDHDECRLIAGCIKKWQRGRILVSLNVVFTDGGLQYWCLVVPYSSTPVLQYNGMHISYQVSIPCTVPVQWTPTCSFTTKCTPITVRCTRYLMKCSRVRSTFCRIPVAPSTVLLQYRSITVQSPR